MAQEVQVSIKNISEGKSVITARIESLENVAQVTCMWSSRLMPLFLHLWRHPNACRRTSQASHDHISLKV